MGYHRFKSVILALLLAIPSLAAGQSRPTRCDTLEHDVPLLKRQIVELKSQLAARTITIKGLQEQNRLKDVVLKDLETKAAGYVKQIQKTYEPKPTILQQLGRAAGAFGAGFGVGVISVIVLTVAK